MLAVFVQESPGLIEQPAVDLGRRLDIQHA
jgi:hypothetical protein